MRQCTTQMLFFKAETTVAFTTVLAFIAFTLTVLPNISLVPAAVAGFTLVLTIAKPGIVNLPFFFTSDAPSFARASRAFVHSDLFRPTEVATASAIPVLGKAFTALAFMAFIAFIAGAIFEFDVQKARSGMP